MARLQQFMVLAALALALAWVCWCVSAGRWLAALAGVMVVAGSPALVLAIEFALLRRAHGEDPTPRASDGQLLRAWWGEVRAAMAVFCWRQPFRSRRWPDGLPATARGRRGVLLIHGFLCNRGVWNRWLERLSRQGVPVVAVDLEPVFGSIDDHRSSIERAMCRIEACTGLAPIVVGHSMGGLALRRWWADPANAARVHHAVTIGTPHRGTWLARFGSTASARQMRAGSRWLQALVDAEPAHRAALFTCFYGHCDNIVFPAQSAALPGADNRHIEAVAHMHMVDREEPWNELQRLLAIDAATRAMPAPATDREPPVTAPA